MKKILLLGINARYSHTNLALLYLKRSIDDLDFNIRIAEFTISEGEDKIFNAISSFKPDVLAISVYIWNTLYIRSILKSIKSNFSEIKIVLGGPEVSYNAKDWLDEFSEIDYIISGEGEAAFRQIALSGFNNEFDNKERIISKPNPHFSRIKFPYGDSDMKSIGNRYIYYESSRGCPFKCTYCLSSVNSQNVEFREIEQVINELDFFSFYDITLIKFVDRVFNLKKDHYMIIWEEILKKFKGKNTSFHFEIFPDLLDNSDIDFLSKVPRGLFQFEIGVQSTKTETLNEIKRKGRWSAAMENIKKVSGLKNIHLHTDIIAGLPHESFSDFSQSFNNVFSLGAEHFQAGFLKILPGTVMMERVKEYGIKYNPIPPYEIIENRWINSSYMAKLKLTGELVELIHNSGKFPETENFMISLYKTPFDFYIRMAEFFEKHENAKHRVWEYQAEILISMISKDHPDSALELADYLRWDWCSVTKLNSYPEILRSELLIKAKKTGVQFFRRYSKKGIINYGDYTFTQNELKRSIFFSPERDEFLKNKMKDLAAMFLPDKRIVWFNPNNQ
ncbi:MAG: B12-binding domain-containing radical SAM protein [Leptospirales bacterium]|nr:B12-binding domain-containing radical SAM protein [Leptospirales bacterium]